MSVGYVNKLVSLRYNGGTHGDVVRLFKVNSYDGKLLKGHDYLVNQPRNFDLTKVSEINVVADFDKYNINVVGTSQFLSNNNVISTKNRDLIVQLLVDHLNKTGNTVHSVVCDWVVSKTEKEKAVTFSSVGKFVNANLVNDNGKLVVGVNGNRVLIGFVGPNVNDNVEVLVDGPQDTLPGEVTTALKRFLGV